MEWVCGAFSSPVAASWAAAMGTAAAAGVALYIALRDRMAAAATNRRHVRKFVGDLAAALEDRWVAVSFDDLSRGMRPADAEAIRKTGAVPYPVRKALRTALRSAHRFDDVTADRLRSAARHIDIFEKQCRRLANDLDGVNESDVSAAQTRDLIREHYARLRGSLESHLIEAAARLAKWGAEPKAWHSPQGRK